MDTGKIQEFAIGGVLALFAVIALFAAARSSGIMEYGCVAVAAIFVGLIFYRIAAVKHGSSGAH
jgi:hypothetical protein